MADHWIKITVHLMTLDDDIRADVSDRFTDGQVDVDMTASPSRSLSLTLYDPGRTLGLDPNDPNEGTVSGNDQIRVVYSVRVPSFDAPWVDIPVFRGPVTGLSRDGSFLAVEAQGKEVFGMNEAWQPRNWNKGADKATVIEQVLADGGEPGRYLDIPSLPGRIPHDMTLGRMSHRWPFAKHLADSMDRHLFYDGRGVCRLRRWPAQPCFTFKTGDGGSVLSLPSFTYDLENVINTVWVLGKKEKKGRPEAVRKLPRTHPLSPWKLGRHGTPRHYVERIERDGVRSKAEAERVARRRIADHKLQTLEVAFDAIPLPHLEPGDWARLHTDDVGMGFRVRAFSIPLTAGQPMTVGYRRRVSKPLGQHRVGDVRPHPAGAPLPAP